MKNKYIIIGAMALALACGQKDFNYEIDYHENITTYTFTEEGFGRGEYEIIGIEANRRVERYIQMYEEWKRAKANTYEIYAIIKLLADGSHEVTEERIRNVERRTDQEGIIEHIVNEELNRH